MNEHVPSTKQYMCSIKQNMSAAVPD